MDNGAIGCEEADKTCMVKRIGMFYLLVSWDIINNSENILDNFQEKFTPMVVPSQIMQRVFSKQEDLINFVSGGMVQKTVMLFAFAKLMNAILQQCQIDGSRMETAVRLLDRE